MTAAAKVPCVDEAMEARYLAACMVDGDVPERHPVSPRELWSKRNATVLEALYALRARGESTDVVAACVELERMGKLKAVGGEAAMRMIASVVELHPAPLAQRLRELAVARGVRERAMRA